MDAINFHLTIILPNEIVELTFLIYVKSRFSVVFMYLDSDDTYEWRFRFMWEAIGLYNYNKRLKIELN